MMKNVAMSLSFLFLFAFVSRRFSGKYLSSCGVRGGVKKAETLHNFLCLDLEINFVAYFSLFWIVMVFQL